MNYVMRFRSVTIAALFAFPSVALAAAQAVDEAAIREVKGGKRTEACAAWWGFDKEESTAALQAAIDSGAKRVIIENKGAPWIVGPIHLAGNQELVFEKGVEILAKTGAFKGRNDCLFQAAGKESITLTGPGATLRMRKSDYQQPPYEPSEWRHALSIRSCTHVRVEGLTIAESGGDGIYLGVAKRGVTNKVVTIRDVILDAHHRQGISVISAEDLLIENCVLKNTSGTPPQAGIDFEPNASDERLINCVMRNCLSENNRGAAYDFYLPHLDGTSAPVSIRLEHCRSKGCGKEAVRWTVRNGGSGGSTKGSAEFIGCEFEGTPNAAIRIAGNAARVFAMRFQDCVIADCAPGTTDVAPITIESRPDHRETVGAITFKDCIVRETLDRQPLQWLDWGGQGLTDLTGVLSVVRDGQTTRYLLDEKQLSQWCPTTAQPKLPHFEMKGVHLRPALPDADAKDFRAPQARIRGEADYLLYARAGDRVSFTLRIIPVGKVAAKAVGARIETPSGKPVAAKKEGDPNVTYVFEASETGPYRIRSEPGASTVVLERTEHRVCLFGEVGPVHLLGSTGPLFIWVPAGTKTFGVKVMGSNMGERVKAALVDPAGKVIEEKDSITLPQVFVVSREDASKGEAWSLRIGKPSVGVLEDFHVDILGVPPLLGGSPEDLLAPGE